MGYSIVKREWNHEGRLVLGILTDGNANELSYDNVQEAYAMVRILNENSNSNIEYEIRPSMDNQDMEGTGYRWTNKKDADKNTAIDRPEAVYGTNMTADANEDIQHMLDVLGINNEPDDDPSN
tara:strand:+ start:9219 stop:9587 length:369 start_codon:yes stop_codon:yes gene_type:complete